MPLRPSPDISEIHIAIFHNLEIGFQMKTGWVLSITDLHAKDKAFKRFSKPRKEVAVKAEELLARYESVFEKDRFKIEISSPHTEIDPSDRMKLSCSAGNIKELFGQLHDLNPFMFKTDDTNVFFEVDLTDEVPDGFTRIEL